MRKNLGRILVIMLSFYVELFATTYTWSAYSSKKEAYVNEAIYLKYVCEFSDRGELYTIDFNPVTDNEKYSVELFSQHTRIADGKRVNSYEYIAFVKKPMLMEFDFDVLMKKTSQDSIENTVLGRDNVEKEEFLTKAVKQKTVKVEIKETNTSLLGEFSLTAKSDKPEIKAYEPYHLSITIKGSGNFNALYPIKFNIDGVKVFDEKPIIDIELTKEGHVGTWHQKFAFVGEKDFKIPALKIEYFDVIEKRVKELVVESRDIKVTPGFKKEELLDEEVESIQLSFDFVYYILTFIAGFLAAKIKFRRVVEDNRDKIFVEKIRDTKSLNELSMLLVLKDSKRFNKLISDIESKVITSLSEAKKLAERSAQ